MELQLKLGVLAHSANYKDNASLTQSTRNAKDASWTVKNAELFEYSGAGDKNGGKTLLNTENTETTAASSTENTDGRVASEGEKEEESGEGKQEDRKGDKGDEGDEGDEGGEEGEEEDEDQDKQDEMDEEEYESVYVSFAFPPNVNELEQTAETNSSNTRTATANDTNVELEDLKANLHENEATSLEKIQISGLSKKKPLVQMHSNLYLGEWSKLVGTELVFNENGKFVTKVDSQLVLHSGKLANYKMEKESLLKRALELAKKVKKNKENVSSAERDLEEKANVKMDEGEESNVKIDQEEVVNTEKEPVPNEEEGTIKGTDSEGDIKMED